MDKNPNHTKKIPLSITTPKPIQTTRQIIDITNQPTTVTKDPVIITSTSKITNPVVTTIEVNLSTEVVQEDNDSTEINEISNEQTEIQDRIEKNSTIMDTTTQTQVNTSTTSPKIVENTPAAISNENNKSSATRLHKLSKLMAALCAVNLYWVR